MNGWLSRAIVRFVAPGLTPWLLPLSAVIVAVGIAVGLLNATSLFTDPYTRPAALFCLLYAIPRAASRFIEWDRDGRFDQLRLAGSRISTLLVSCVFAIAGPLIAAGLFFLWAAGHNRFRFADVVTVAVVWLTILTMSMVAVALPRGRAIDTRLMTIGLITMLGLLAVFTTVGPRAAPYQNVSILASLLGISPITMLIAVSVALMVVVVLVMPRVLRVTARPGVARAAGAFGRSRRPRGYGVATEASRLAVAGATPAAVMMAIAVTAIAVAFLIFDSEQSSQFQPRSELAGAGGALDALLFVSALPLIAGAFVISSTARAERDSGRLDVLRLMPSAIPRLLPAIVAAYWTPFLLAGTIALCVLGLFTGSRSERLWAMPLPGVVSLIVLIIAVAPLPLIEGWRRAWPLTYGAPVFLLFVGLGGNYWTDAMREVAVAWVPWVVAMRTLRHPDDPPLTAPIAAAVMGAVALVATLEVVAFRSVLDAAAVVAPIGALGFTLISLCKHPRTARERLQPGVAAAIVTAAMVAIGPLRTIDGLLVALVPLAAWWAGWRLHELTRGGRWSLPLRLAAAFLVMQSGLMWVRVWMAYFDLNLRGTDLRDRHLRASMATWTHLIFVAQIIGGALVVEVAFRLRTRMLHTSAPEVGGTSTFDRLGPHH